MQDLLDSVPAAGWAILGAAAGKLVSWMLAFRNAETERITKTYDAVNTAQKVLVEGLFSQVADLRAEIQHIRLENKEFAERNRQAHVRIEELQDEVSQLKTELQSYKPEFASV